MRDRAEWNGRRRLCRRDPLRSVAVRRDPSEHLAGESGLADTRGAREHDAAARLPAPRSPAPARRRVRRAATAAGRRGAASPGVSAACGTRRVSIAPSCGTQRKSRWTDRTRCFLGFSLRSSVVRVSSRLLTTAGAPSVIAGGVDRDEAVFRLPSTYQRVMAWLAEDVAPEEIAARLGIDPQRAPGLDRARDREVCARGRRSAPAEGRLMGRAPPGGDVPDLSGWPLVGRDDEIALASSALGEWQRCADRSRRCREDPSRARGHHHGRGGSTTERNGSSRRHAAAAVPLGAVAHLVPSESIGRGRDATLGAIVRALQHGERDGRLLLGVDDAHLLDDASAALVHLLVTNGVASVVLTLRSGEPAPDSIVALWKDGPAALIELQALARTEVDTIATTVLDGSVEGATLHFLWEASAGNALFLHELIRHGVDSGALRCEQGLWRWPGPLDPGERLHDVVALRMGALTEEDRSTLELVAVGEPLTAGCLSAARCRRVCPATRATRPVASRRTHSSTTSARETWLAHPLFGEVLRGAMPPAALDQLRLALADAVEACGDVSDRDQFRVTLWRLDAGDRSRPEAIRAAAARALRLWDHAIAERLAARPSNRDSTWKRPNCWPASCPGRADPTRHSTSSRLHAICPEPIRCAATSRRARRGCSSISSAGSRRADRAAGCPSNASKTHKSGTDS